MVKEHILGKNRELSVFMSCSVHNIYIPDREVEELVRKGERGDHFSFLCKAPSQTLK